MIRDALKTLAGLGVVTVRHGMGKFSNEVAKNKGNIEKKGGLLVRAKCHG